jgi:hypothetical protein
VIGDAPDMECSPGYICVLVMAAQDRSPADGHSPVTRGRCQRGALLGCAPCQNGHAGEGTADPQWSATKIDELASSYRRDAGVWGVVVVVVVVG